MTDAGRRWILLALWIVPNVILSLVTVFYNVVLQRSLDWRLYTGLREALERGDLYVADSNFVWSPVAAWILAYLIVPLGLPVWTAAHFAVLPLLRPRMLIALTLVSAAFWTDVSAGHMFVFVFVVAALALRGSTTATVAYFALTLLAPRAVQLPLMLWLLWRRPASRAPFAALFVVHAVLVLLSGYAGDWIAAATSYGPELLGVPWNWGPTYLFGYLWFVVGVPLAILLAWRGYLGLSGLAISPYVLPQYWLFLLVDVVRERERGRK